MCHTHIYTFSNSHDQTLKESIKVYLDIRSSGKHKLQTLGAVMTYELLTNHSEESDGLDRNLLCINNTKKFNFSIHDRVLNHIYTIHLGNM